MSKAWITVAACVFALCACDFDRTLAIVEPQQGKVTVKDIPVTLNRDVDTKVLKSGATIEFSGTEDTVRVQLAGRKVSVLTYLCVPD